MGSDGTVFIFDDTAFAHDVAPALDALVSTGARAPWLNDLLARRSRGYLEITTALVENRGFSFHDVCAYLDDNFAFEDREADQWSYSWDNRACSSSTCPARHICPLHRSTAQGAAVEFNWLFEACIVDRTLGEGQFTGRTVSPLWYFDELSALGVRTDGEIGRLLRKLEFRGFVAGYQFGNSDGIHGWLYADETRRLVEALSGLDLPLVEQSFPGMRALHRPGAGYHVPDGYSWKRLSLAFLRTVAHLAVAESKGILWGNDVATEWAEAAS